MDDISQAVLARDEVARYLRGGHGGSEEEARVRVMGYLDELQTTQRYPLYKALKTPIYPILRKIKRVVEHVEIPQAATAAGRVIYASNHKSHTDYLVEPVVLDDHRVRPPVIAAGINLFGGPLGFINRHVTGAIPIRRNTKDPAYLVTLKAYVAEFLGRRDLLFYPEGGRSYSGEMKPLKTGLIHAAMQADVPGLVVIPVAIAYDIVLEDAVLSRQGVKKRQRPFTAELAEMARYAVGYKTRAFVTFGQPIPTAAFDAQSRRDVLDLAHQIRDAIGRLYKVTPTALVAAAMRPAIDRQGLESRIDELIGSLKLNGANLSVESGRQAVDQGCRMLSHRGVIAVEGDRCRVRNRAMLRYYARTINHLVSQAAERAS
jgi:1-acyl-sn-glycerol-3-phosphate acyltransferase